MMGHRRMWELDTRPWTLPLGVYPRGGRESEISLRIDPDSRSPRDQTNRRASRQGDRCPAGCKDCLDRPFCKGYLDGMIDDRSPAQMDREVMAMMLITNVQLVAGVLRADDDSEGRVARAIAATRSLETIVEDTLRALVGQARSAGHTWAEIGDLLHVTRQAAFQRFGAGRRPDPEDAANEVAVAGAVERAVPVLEAFIGSRFDEVRSAFDERMLNACSVELLRDVRRRVSDHAGEVQGLGTPLVSVRDGYTVVDIPVALEHADGIGRVVLNADRQVAGFFVRPKEAIA
jgi:hypothetical protein